MKGCLKTLGLLFSAFLFFVVLIMLIGWAVERYYARETFSFTWDDTVENPQPTVQHRYVQDGKHRGVSLVGRRGLEVGPLIRNNIEWIALTPFGWQEAHNSTVISTAPEAGEPWGLRDDELEQMARTAKQQGLRVFLKPHLWLTRSGKWRSEIEMDDEAAWHRWFQSYRAFLLHYALLAERLGLDMLSVGTELQRATALREADWRALIDEVRQVYHGKLTYAANWNDEFEAVAFWDALDYIGIQAYFPLTDRRTPSVDTLRHGWIPHVRALEQVSQRYDRPVLFTEIGYKSTTDSATEPWRWGGLMNGWFQQVSVQTQVHCYQAFFEMFWEKSWFAGAYLWQWHARHGAAGGPSSRGFTPQNKATQNVVATWYGARPMVNRN